MSEHVFMCYAREDEGFVLRLATALKARGAQIWVDQWEIPKSADWDRTIDDALLDCAHFLIVLSPASVESDEVRGELRTALDEDKHLVPVLYKQCHVPRRLRLLQFVDVSEREPDDEFAAAEVLDALHAPVSKGRETSAASATTDHTAAANGASIDRPSSQRGVVLEPDERLRFDSDVILVKWDHEDLHAILRDGRWLKSHAGGRFEEMGRFPFSYSGTSKDYDWQSNDLRPGVGLVLVKDRPVASLWRLGATSAIPLETTGEDPWAANFLSDDVLLTASGDGCVRMWRSDDGSLIREVSAGVMAPTTSVTSANEAGYFATGHSNGRVCLFDLEGNVLASDSCGSDGVVWGIRFAPDDRMLAATCEWNVALFRVNEVQSSVSVEKAETRRVVKPREGHSELKQVVWTGDGFLAAASKHAVYQLVENKPWFDTGSTIWSIAPGPNPREVIVACGLELLRFTLG